MSDTGRFMYIPLFYPKVPSSLQVSLRIFALLYYFLVYTLSHSLTESLVYTPLYCVQYLISSVFSPKLPPPPSPPSPPKEVNPVIRSKNNDMRSPSAYLLGAALTTSSASAEVRPNSTDGESNFNGIVPASSLLEDCAATYAKSLTVLPPPPDSAVMLAVLPCSPREASRSCARPSV